jgi:DNA-directed RNA polymerase subunit M/transcription elongation factor TFIIS
MAYGEGGNLMNNLLRNVTKMVLLKRKCQCPECGAVLSMQESFDENNEINVCEKCGQKLANRQFAYQGERFPGVTWFCDDCGTILNTQEGFRDIYPFYRCDKCGYLNRITEDEAFDSIEEKREHRKKIGG